MPENLITLCWRCHAEAHGVDVTGTGYSRKMLIDTMYQYCVEYLADYYAEEGWYPYK